MIEASYVNLTYMDGTVALKNVDFKIEPGELVYITGPSGSGKTSLLKLFMGVEYPTTGYLNVLGQSIEKDNKSGIRHLRTKIGPVFQEFRLIKGRNVLENIMIGMRFLNIPSKQIKENASNALARVGLEHKALSLVENLSWGERQRVAIARAVARNPALILADEPTGNLDKDNAIKILELLDSFRDEKTSIVITTHATHLIDYKDDIKLIQVNEGNVHCERLGLAK